MKEIPLTKGKVAIVDDEDYEWLMQWKWYASGGYACRYEKIDGHIVWIRMHRQIMGFPPDGLVVDHINHNKRDNRRKNLRTCTYVQNTSNRGPAKNRNRYKGMTWDKHLKKWRVRIRTLDHELMELGFFDDEIEAAKTYDAAARICHGEFAYLNFPDDF